MHRCRRFVLERPRGKLAGQSPKHSPSIFQMAWRFAFAPPLQPCLLTINIKFNPQNSFSIFGKSLKSSMLKRLLISSSSRYCFSKKPIKFHLHPFFRRPIHSLSVLAMAEQSSSSSSSHKHNNRLTSEHSPYLLQHAHNPVLHITTTTFKILSNIDESPNLILGFWIEA